MKLALDRIDTHGLRLDPTGAGDQVVALASTTNLRGTLALDGSRMHLPDLVADEVVIATLRMLLGALVLSSKEGATLTSVGLALASTTERLDVKVSAARLAATDIGVVIDDVTVGGRVTLDGVELVVDGDRGSLSAARVELAGFGLRIGDVDLAADLVRGERVTIAWGEDFQLHAASLEAPALMVSLPGTRLAVTGASVHTLGVAGGSVTAGEARIASSQVDVAMAGPPAEAAVPDVTAPSGSSAPAFDLGVLDALSGQLDVDVAVDLTVPIIGRRKATHRLRVAIDHGSIDYRALERNLSRLEDALLDFSVRDGGLALERVNPLFPSRGHGKPIIAWPLGPADLALAEQDRVRLAVLPQAKVVGSDEPKAPDAKPSKSPIALRHLALLAIDAHLSLGPVVATTGPLRPKHLRSLVLRGHVLYDPGEPAPPGEIEGSMEGLAASVHALGLGTSTLDVDDISIGSVADLHVSFADVTPTAIAFRVNELALSGLALRPRR